MRKNVLLLGMLVLGSLLRAQPPMLLNAETANEMDDLYAITYLLVVTGDELLALSAAHFNNVDLLTDSLWTGYSTRGIRTLELSFPLNRLLLPHSGRGEVKYLKSVPKMFAQISTQSRWKTIFDKFMMKKSALTAAINPTSI